MYVYLAVDLAVDLSIYRLSIYTMYVAVWF